MSGTSPLTDHVIHFPDGAAVPMSYTRLLQNGDEFRREAKDWRVEKVELRDDGWHIWVVGAEAEADKSE